MTKSRPWLRVVVLWAGCALVELAACTPLPDPGGKDEGGGGEGPGTDAPGPSDPSTNDCALSSIVEQYDLAVNELRGRMSKNVQSALEACRSIAESLGAAVPEGAGVDVECNAARGALGTRGIGSFGYKALGCLQPTARFAECLSACAGAPCDLATNPPSCMGGRMEIGCSGACVPFAGGATIRCSGGVCETNPTPWGADGVECAAACKPPSPSSSVICDGACEGAATLRGCRGGRLEDGCAVDAVCATACIYRAIAAAECTANPIATDEPTLAAPLQALAEVHPGIGLGDDASGLGRFLNARPPCATSERVPDAELAAFFDAVQGARSVLER